MRTITILTLSIALAFTASACDSDEETTSGGDATMASDATLTPDATATGDTASATDATSAPDTVATSPESLCTASGGTWDPSSCGHWACGMPPACDAIDPGCNCGADNIFNSLVGCVAGPMCAGDMGPDVLCESTGGTWDESSCGHYVCGNQPDCEALIPGCDCGAGNSFENATGCYDDPTCPQ